MHKLSSYLFLEVTNHKLYKFLISLKNMKQLQIIGDTPRKKEIYIPENPKEHIPRLVKAGVIVFNDQILKPSTLKPEVQEEEEEREPATVPSMPGFIYIPSIKLQIAEQRTHQNKNWYECHNALAEENSRMLTIPEFIEFLKHVKTERPEIYEIRMA